MTWYCVDWTRNLTGQWPDQTFEDGDDCDDIYRNARCTTFRRRGDIYVDEDDDQYDSMIDDHGEAYCQNHDNEAEWDATYSAAGDLRAAGFYVCEDCDGTYHTLDAHDEHRLNEHDDDDNEAIHTTTTSVITSHSTWA